VNRSLIKRSLLFVGLFIVGFTGFNVVNDNVYADCGATGGPHGYAGAIVDVKIRRKGNLIEGKGGIYNVNTLDRTDGGQYPNTSPGGNIVRLQNPSVAANGRYDSANFTQIVNNCPQTHGSESLVFGYGATSQPQGGLNGSWALDCDLSVHPGVTQKFRITGIQKPSNALNGYWEVGSVEVGPANGNTANPPSLIWVETQPDPPGTSVDINFVNCTTIQWSVLSTVAASYRIVVSPNGNVATDFVVASYTNGASGTFERNFGGQARQPIRAYYQFPTRANPGPNDWTTPAGAVYTNPNGGKVCGNTAPNLQISATCTRINFTNLRDPDNGSAVRYTWRVHELDAAGNPSAQPVVVGSGQGIGSFSAPISPYENNGVNNGFRVFVEAVDTDADGNYRGYVTASANTGICYSATCELTTLNPNLGKPGAVEAGRPYNISLVVRNTGQLPIPASAIKVAYDYPAGNRNLLNSSTSGNVPGLGGTAFVSSTSGGITAPNGVTSYGMYPYFNNFFALGPVCTSINSYVKFQIDPSAGAVQMGPDVESPTQISFSSNAKQILPGGKEIVPNITISRAVTRKDNGSAVSNFQNAKNQGLNTVGMSFGPSQSSPWQDTYTGAIDPNLEYCGRIAVTPAAGWYGPGGDMIVTDPDESENSASCVSRLDKPYIKAFGGDVVAGAVFPNADGSCAVGVNSDIKANIRPLSEVSAGTKSGAGTQLSAMAPGSVTGFLSASLRTTAPTTPAGLTSLSGTTGTGDLLSPYMGGAYQANKCLDDYYTTQQVSEGSADIQTNIIDTNNVNVTDLMTKKQTVFKAANVTLNGGNMGSTRHSMFVDGDVYIRSNIILNSSFGGNRDNIGSFRMFVKGNIYIDKSVSQLDGLYIAQPITDGSKGKIFTCSSGIGNPINNPSQRFNECGTQLRVYGSFIANEVILGRTTNSIRDSIGREEYSGPNSTRAAEIFVFTPEVYLANSAVKPSSRATSGEYQYIATLPPIL